MWAPIALSQASAPAGRVAAAVPTATVAADQAERARLIAQREAITARFAAEERACRERFIVTACLDEVRVRRRDALAPIRLRELQLGDAERRARAAERKAALAEKQRTAQQRDAGLPAPEVRLRAAPSAAASAPRANARPPMKPDDSASRASEAAERVKAREQRVQASEAAQERVRKRLAERAASGKVAEPLPPPDLPGSGGRR